MAQGHKITDSPDQPALAPHLTHGPLAKPLREGIAALDTDIRRDRRYYRSDQEQHNHAYPNPEQQHRCEQIHKRTAKRLLSAGLSHRVFPDLCCDGWT